MEKTYLSASCIRLYNIKIIYNNEVVYEGPSENVPQNYKDLKYYKIEISSGIITLYVTNEN